jgi:hypothetical protein
MAGSEEGVERWKCFGAFCRYLIVTGSFQIGLAASDRMQ